MSSGYRSSKEVLLGNEKSPVDGLYIEPFFKKPTNQPTKRTTKKKKCKILELTSF